MGTRNFGGRWALNRGLQNVATSHAGKRQVSSPVTIYDAEGRVIEVRAASPERGWLPVATALRKTRRFAKRPHAVPPR